PAEQTTDLGLLARAAADVRVAHANGRTIYHQRTTSALFDVPVTPIPASRGVTCSARQADGSPADLGDGCPVTDGRFDVPLSTLRQAAAEQAARAQADGGEPPASLPPPAPVTEVTVDLGSPIELSLVVLRRAGLGLQVAASADGATWTALDPLRDD